MEGAPSADQLQQESGKTHHRQATIPDLGAVVPAPGPLVLGIELRLGGQLGRLIQVDLGALQGVLHQVGSTPTLPHPMDMA